MTRTRSKKTVTGGKTESGAAEKDNSKIFIDRAGTTKNSPEELPNNETQNHTSSLNEVEEVDPDPPVSKSSNSSSTSSSSQLEIHEENVVPSDVLDDSPADGQTNKNSKKLLIDLTSYKLSQDRLSQLEASLFGSASESEEENSKSKPLIYHIDKAKDSSEPISEPSDAINDLIFAIDRCGRGDDKPKSEPVIVASSTPSEKKQGAAKKLRMKENPRKIW